MNPTRPGHKHDQAELLTNELTRVHASKIGKELGRSAGAVFNALEKLVAAGWAVRTSDAPKRYTAASGTDTSAAADTAPDAAAPDAQREAAQSAG